MTGRRIKFEPIHTKVAERVSLRRQEEAVRLGREAHNGAPTDWNSALRISTLGVKTEVAGKLYLNPIKWHHLAQRIHNLPDLGDFIDVKGQEVKRQGNSLFVQKDDPADWAYFLVIQSGPIFFDMIGWCWGREAKVEKYWDKNTQKGRPAFSVEWDDPILKSPESLRAIVHPEGK